MKVIAQQTTVHHTVMTESDRRAYHWSGDYANDMALASFEDSIWEEFAAASFKVTIVRGQYED
jgi:hypothetical protein